MYSWNWTPIAFPAGDDVAEPHPAHLGVVGNRVDDVPALGDDGEGAFLDRRNAEEVHVARGGEEAGAVGADDLGASFGRGPEDLRFDPLALITGFSETRRDDHDPFCTHLHAVRHGLGDQFRGDDDHDEVHLLPDIEDRGIGLPPEQGIPLGVNQEDLSRVTPLDQTPRPPLGRLAGNLGGPDDRDGGGFEKTVQRLHDILLVRDG